MKNTLLIALLTLFAATAAATHNRSGYIFYRQMDNLTVEATVVTWTKASSRPADRDTITVCWGDGICERVARTNGAGDPPQGDTLGFDTKRNFYTAIHAYSSMETYTISMTDPNRNGGIVNVNFPNSDQVKFHIETTFTLLDVEGGRANHSPRLLSEPTTLIGHIYQPFAFAPEAYDPDADSLSFELTVPLQDIGSPVPNYVPLTEVEANPDNQLFLDPHTGKMIWASPYLAGEYNVAVLIRSFRDGQEISTAILDMQIIIQDMGNTMPTLSLSPSYNEGHLHCLSVGDTLELNLTALEDGLGEEARVELYSGLNEILAAPEGFSYTDSPRVAVFRWIIAEEQEREQPYQLTIKVVDGQAYADYRVLRFVVKGCARSDAGQQIRGTCFWDANENGIQDGDETAAPNRRLRLSPAGLVTAGNDDGEFAFYVTPGSYRLQALEDPCWYLTTDSVSYTIDLEAGTQENRAFGFNRLFENDTEFAASLASGTTRCNREVPFWLTLRNTACRAVGGWIALIRDGEMAGLASASQDPDYVSGDTLWWAFDPVPPSKNLDWELIFELGGVQFVGMEMNFEVLVFSEDCAPIGQTGIQGPWDPDFEDFRYCARYSYNPVLLCAYDPNDKLVQPARGEGKNYTLFGEQLEYTIRFQNTGNDTAFLVVLRDTLDPSLDWNTFRPFSASHPYEFVLDERTGALAFTFRDINLPDSTANESASHGFVSYTISARPGLAENTPVANRAGIYFDSNPPILTNTTENTMVSQLPGTTSVQEPSGLESLEVKVYPNPFAEAIHFEIQSPEEQRMLLEIFDLSGRRLYSGTDHLRQGATFLSLSGSQLPGSGTFIYKISTRDGVRCGKIVKLD